MIGERESSVRGEGGEEEGSESSVGVEGGEEEGITSVNSVITAVSWQRLERQSCRVGWRRW